MGDTTLKLRTVAFGGFHRQDVVDYIEANTREHTAQLNALRAELKQAQTSLEALAGERSRADDLARRCDELSRRVEELAPLEAEAAELRAGAEEYRPKAEAYDRLKDALAEMELEARSRAAGILEDADRRAEAVLTQAAAEAEATRGAAGAEAETIRAEAADLLRKAQADRAEARDVLDRVTEEYGRVGDRADQAILRVIDQLGDLRSALTGLGRPDANRPEAADAAESVSEVQT